MVGKMIENLMKMALYHSHIYTQPLLTINFEDNLKYRWSGTVLFYLRYPKNTVRSSNESFEKFQWPFSAAKPSELVLGSLPAK